MAPGNFPLIPVRAEQIDRKLDDGAPSTGMVRALGIVDSCFGNSEPYAYQAQVTSKDCNLAIRIKN